MIRRAVIVMSVGLALASGVLVSMTRADRFSHSDHAGLFPTCLGCHSGIPQGNEDLYFSVVPKDCVRCHDGEREGTVDWTEPARTASNLIFVHVDHAAELEAAGDSALACAACHGPFGADEPRMAIDRAAPETCTGCHAHDASEHLAAEAVCSDCHAILTDSPDLSTTRVAEFPEPPSHSSDGFVLEHGSSGEGALESCAVCHARETCTRCHLNAGSVEEIQEIQPDPRVAMLVEGEPAEWPEPPSHDKSGWEFNHGDEIEAGSQSCATCHAETSCRTCHGSAAIPAIAALPNPGEGEPAGVVVPRTSPPGHLPLFATQHGAAVAADMPRCSSCHIESQCAECHEGPNRVAGEFAPRRSTGSNGTAGDPPGAEQFLHANATTGTLPPEPRSGYHPANFLLRHGAEAFAVQTVCSDCHSTEAFCRECHQSIGITLGAGDGAGGAFHDAQANWFFEHGRAARQGLEGCASCHQQTSCLRCHSAKSGLRISPHGPGFDPSRVATASTESCGIRHTSLQIVTP
ncbi:MAG: hypothetical protein E4H28_03645 [Gemmatimonadales bacterium]|nr:MAG: hypothetical protein E4H28_03645 [Gemmatimonadales bacterium]